MQRIFFVNRFFSPDHSATSQLVGDVASHLAASGYEVHVVTSRQLYDQPQAQLPADSVVDGVHVHRVRTTRFGRSTLIGRTLDYFSFYVFARRALMSLLQSDDIVVAMTDPPLISVVAMAVARRQGAHLVNWLQDLYPEIAVQLSVPFIKGPALWALLYLRDRGLKFARANVAVGELMAQKLASRKIAPQRIHVISNWSDDIHIVPIPPVLNPLRQEWQLRDRLVVGYSGNLGRAHEFNTVLDAAERLRDHPEIVFLFIGGGHHFDELAQQVASRKLPNFRFVGYQNRSTLKFSLCVPDVHWISLKPEVEGLVVPSKFYGIAAAGRPIVAICSKDGEIARLVEQYQCGFVVEPGQDQTLAETLLELSKNARLRALLGQRAQAMLESHFTRDRAFTRWRAVVENIA